MAAPLTEYLDSTGTYHGIDVIPEAIKWCKRAISRRFPNFTFLLADVANTNYNPKGRWSPTSYVFPFSEKSFDLAFMTSVFTHMDLPSVANYLNEIARMLRIGGTCLATYFLVNDQALAQRHLWQPQLPFSHGPSFAYDNLVPEVAIAHPESDIRSLYEKAGLCLTEPPLWGSWSGRSTFVSHQDILIAYKRPTDDKD